MNNKHVEADGAVVYWSAGPTRRDLLIARLSHHSMENLVPEQRTDSACLKSAMLDYCDQRSQRRKGQDKLVQARKRQSTNGFEVLDVDRREHGNEYRMDFAAKVLASGSIAIVNGTANVGELTALFQTQKSQLTGQAVGKLLTNVLAQLGGTCLRPAGGVYWIPGSQIATWETVSNIVEAAAVDGGRNAVYAITHTWNERSVRAVKDAIIDEVTDASNALMEDIKQNQLGSEALVRRQVLAAALHGRVTQYEAILGQALTALHDSIRVNEEAAAAALSVHDASSQFAGIL